MGGRSFWSLLVKAFSPGTVSLVSYFCFPRVSGLYHFFPQFSCFLGARAGFCISVGASIGSLLGWSLIASPPHSLSHSVFLFLLFPSPPSFVSIHIIQYPPLGVSWSFLIRLLFFRCKLLRGVPFGQVATGSHLSTTAGH